MITDKRESRPKLCMTAALAVCICVGFGYAWSVIQTPIITVHNWPQAKVTLAYTVTVLCSTMAPMLFGKYISKLSTRVCIMLGSLLFGAGLFLSGTMTALWQLFFFYGVLSGLGCGLIYPRLMAYVVKLYPDNAGLASGLGTAAYGSGAIIWAPVTVKLMDAYSLDHAFKILGAAFFFIILICSLFLADPKEERKEEFESILLNNDLNRSQMVKTPQFYITIAVFTCGLIAGVIVISQASPILQQELGFTPALAAVLVGVFSACNMAGRFLWGSIYDKIGIHKTMMLVFVFCFLSMIAMAFTSQQVLFLIAMGLGASCYGGFACMLTPLTAQLFGRRYLTENYGVMYIVFGIASLIGPVLAAGFKSTGSYSGAFYSAAGLALLGLILSRMIPSK